MTADCVRSRPPPPKPAEKKSSSSSQSAQLALLSAPNMADRFTLSVLERRRDDFLSFFAFLGFFVFSPNTAKGLAELMATAFASALPHSAGCQSGA